MESDSENEHNSVSETRSRNSSISSTDEPAPRPSEVEFVVEPNPGAAAAVAAAGLRRRSNQGQSDSRARRKHGENDGNLQPSVPGQIVYHGVSFPLAAYQGNLPLTVLLWGMAAAKKINLMIPDAHGNNPFHYAVLADTPEVMGFMLQRTRGMISPDTRLVDSRNVIGETPLLRALAVGRIPVIKALIEEGSDPFVEDFNGNSAFIVLARNGQLWGMNFFFTFVSERYGSRRVLELLHAVDKEGHGALDWAADFGSVNVIEYLIRRGLDPYRVDQGSRGPLHWAVKAGRHSAVRFLYYCGCDPLFEDSTGQSPLGLAEAKNDSEMVAILTKSIPAAIRPVMPSLQTVNLSDGPTDLSLAVSSGPHFQPPQNAIIRGRFTREQSSNDLEFSNLNLQDKDNSPVTPSLPIKLSAITSSSSSSTTSTISTSSMRGNSINLTNADPETAEGARDDPSQSRSLSNPFFGMPSYKLEGALIVSYEDDSSASSFASLLSCCGLFGGQAESLHRGSSDAAVGSPEAVRDPSSINLRRSKAVYRLNESRLSYALLYGLVVLSYWLLTMCLPVYAFVPFLFVSWMVLQRVDGAAAAAVKRSRSSIQQQNALQAQGNLPEVNNSSWSLVWQTFIQARERYLGLYIGSFGAVAYYWLYCFGTLIGSLDSSPDVDAASKDGVVNFLIGGTSGSTKDMPLLFATAAMLLVSLCLWTRLVWLGQDPGSVDTRYYDFEYLLQASLRAAGPPPSQLYCRSLLVRKPVRSKYCATTGLVIARMDHYCIWLNTSIGYGNHRAFYLFLWTHFISSLLLVTFIIRGLMREIGPEPSCGYTEAVLGNTYFFVTSLCAFLFVIALGLGALIVDQTMNIFRNITTNEKINQSRYAWMVSETGTPCNRFDRGCFSNVLEFWRLPGFSKDYRNVFDIPAGGGAVLTMAQTATLQQSMQPSSSPSPSPPLPPHVTAAGSAVAAAALPLPPPAPVPAPFSAPPSAPVNSETRL